MVSVAAGQLTVQSHTGIMDTLANQALSVT